jgi:hypothetical protein
VKEDAVLGDRDDPEHLGPDALRGIDGAAALVTLALVALVGLDITGPLRLLLALGFVTFVPGWAMFGHSRLADGTSKVALAVAASLTGCTVTALAMAWLRAWHPFALFYALGAASLLPLVWRAARRPARADTDPADTEPAVDEAAPSAPVPVAAPAGTPRPPAAEAAAEQLPLSGIAVRVVFLTRPAFAAHELTDLFAAIQDDHPFTDFHRDAAGAVMDLPGSRRLEIRRDGLDYRETAPFDFQQARRRAVDLLGVIQERLGVQYLTNPSYRLEATVAASGPLPGVDPHLLAIFDSAAPVAVGFRLSGTSDAPQFTWQVIMEPDTVGGRVAVDLITDFALPAAGPGAVGEHLQQSHHFLTGNVVRFLESLRAPSGD